MREYFGADPDLHDTAIGTIEEYSDQLLFKVRLISISKDLKGREAMIEMCQQIGKRNSYLPSANSYLAIEGQEFYTNKNATMSDIGLLACVTGALLASACYLSVFCPKPVEWKGNVPKHIHHGRIAAELGFEIKLMGGQNGYGVPADEKIRKQLPKASDWKHGMDALGLALWAKKQAKKVAT